MASMEKLQADTLAEITKLNMVLQDVEQKKDQLSQAWSAQDMKVKKLDDEVCDAEGKASKRVADLQAKTTDLTQEAERLFSCLDKCCSDSN
uniref:Uncharacterized protein n=1 Tax=Oryza brachyantha TaxID=4533 RepID=J3N1M9_ORYBR